MAVKKKPRVRTRRFKFALTVKIDLDNLPEGFKFSRADVREMIENAISEHCSEWRSSAGIHDDVSGWVASARPEVKAK